MAKTRSERRKNARKNQKNALQTKEGRLQYVKKMADDVLEKRFREGKGRKRHADKLAGVDMYFIYTGRTKSNYKGIVYQFAKWASENMTAEELEGLKSFEDNLDWIPHVNSFLQHCIDKGLSATTQAVYKAGIAKTIGVSSTAFIPTQIRYRALRTNNRFKKEDDRLSEDSNKYWASIVSATGLRKNELKNITGDALKRGRGGKWYLDINGHKHKTKGRRDRWSPIMASSQEELDMIIHLFQEAGRNRVFHVPEGLRPHKYRAKYAERVYKSVERDINTIPFEERVHLRKELRGIVLDRKACKVVSKAIGHNRSEEFQKSYAYTLLHGYSA